MPSPIGDPVWGLLSEVGARPAAELEQAAVAEASDDSAGSRGIRVLIRAEPEYVEQSDTAMPAFEEAELHDGFGASAQVTIGTAIDQLLEELFDRAARSSASAGHSSGTGSIAPLSDTPVLATVASAQELAGEFDAGMDEFSAGSFDSGETAPLLAAGSGGNQDASTTTAEQEQGGNGGFGGSGSSEPSVSQEWPDGQTVNPGPIDLGSGESSNQIPPEEGGGASQQSGCTVSSVTVERFNEETQAWEQVTDGILAAADLARYSATVTPAGGQLTWWRSKDFAQWESFGGANPQEYLESDPAHWRVFLSVQQGMDLCSSPIEEVNVYHIDIGWLPITLFNPEVGETETNVDDENPVEHGGGWRWFAEKNTPNGPVHNQVKYLVQVTPADQSVPFYHKLFNVDDPTRTAPPVDFPGDPPNHPGGPDNRLASINNSEGQWMTGPGGSLSVTITLAAGDAYAGDNWRKVVAIKQDRINVIDVEEPSSTGALLNVGGHGVAQTPMLSIWRKMWIELDHMGPPPLNEQFQQNPPTSRDCAPPTPTDNSCSPGPGGGAQREPTFEVFQIAYRPAYIETRRWLAAQAVPFAHNLDGFTQRDWGDEGGQFDFRETPNGDVWYWTAYAISAYEGELFRDHDPNGEAADFGTTVPSLQQGRPETSAVFLETIRDFYHDAGFNWSPDYPQSTFEQQTLAHEIAHQFTVPDRNANDPVRSLMSTVVPPDGRPDDFADDEIDIIRDQTML